MDLVPRLVPGDDELLEVLVEDVADDADREVGLTVQEHRGLAARRRAGCAVLLLALALARAWAGRLLGLGLDVLPRPGEALDVGAQLLLARPLGGGADDDAGGVRHDVAQDLLEAGALGVGQLAADARHRAVGHVDEVAAGQRDLRGETRTLVADRVLRDLHEHGLTGAEGVLDALGLVGLEAGGVPVDLTGVEHGVAALADVDEGGLHRGQDVLDPAEVDVAGHRDVRGLVDVVLDEDTVLEDAHLGAPVLVAHDHDPVDGLAAGEELGLGDDRATAAGLTALTTALLLRLETGRALDGDRLVALGARLTHAGRDVGGVVAGLGGGAGAAAATATTARATLVVGVTLGVGVDVGVGVAVGLRLVHGLDGPSTCSTRTSGVVRVGLLVLGLVLVVAAATAALAATAAARAAGAALLVGLGVGLLVGLGQVLVGGDGLVVLDVLDRLLDLGRRRAPAATGGHGLARVGRLEEHAEAGDRGGRAGVVVRVGDADGGQLLGLVERLDVDDGGAVDGRGLGPGGGVRLRLGGDLVVSGQRAGHELLDGGTGSVGLGARSPLRGPRGRGCVAGVDLLAGGALAGRTLGLGGLGGGARAASTRGCAGRVGPVAVSPVEAGASAAPSCAGDASAAAAGSMVVAFFVVRRGARRRGAGALAAGAASAAGAWASCPALPVMRRARRGTASRRRRRWCRWVPSGSLPSGAV